MDHEELLNLLTQRSKWEAWQMIHMWLSVLWVQTGY
jgi:hypothetical protein